MGLRDRFSNFLLGQVVKRGWVDDLKGTTLRWGGSYINDDTVMKSSDVNELVNDISNQIAMAKPVVIGPNGKENKHHTALKQLQNPNDYQTGFEFARIQAITLLLQGEVYPIVIGNQLHLASDVYSDLDNQLTEHFKIGGTEVPGSMIEHIKIMSTDSLHGSGLIKLGKDTLQGVVNAESVLTDKYAKGGLLAFLLKLDSQLNPKNAVQSALVKALKEQFESIDRDHEVKIVPLGKGYEIDTLKSPVEDDKILAYLNVYKKDLGKYLGINVDTYQSIMKTDIEKAMMYMHNKSVKPILKNLGQHYTKLLLPKNSMYHIEYKIDILDFVPYSVKTNIGYNIVRTGITSPDNVAAMLGFPKQNTPETQAIYISNDLTKINEKKATDDSLPTKGGDDDDSQSKGNSNV